MSVRHHPANRRPAPAASARQRILDRREACPRRALAAAVDAGGDGYAALSRMLGRPDGYLGRFVREGFPRALRPDEHQRLAAFFGMDSRGLGVRDLWVAE